MQYPSPWRRPAGRPRLLRPGGGPGFNRPGGARGALEVLETSAPNIANRRYEAYTDALIPAGDYGELVPYIGGEVMPAGPFTTYLYGLATHEGEIVTDPVYFSVESCRWYDARASAAARTRSSSAPARPSRARTGTLR